MHMHIYVYYAHLCMLLVFFLLTSCYYTVARCCA